MKRNVDGTGNFYAKTFLKWRQRYQGNVVKSATEKNIQQIQSKARYTVCRSNVS